MALTMARTSCAVCGDRFQRQEGDCCGRCQRVVCRACADVRGRWHESVLCVECQGGPRPHGLRATPVYRAWRRMMAG